jgi:hypothetical protein
MSGTCECGKPDTGQHHVWNGMHHMSVCDECWYDPENIILEACIMFAEGGAKTLEECLRVEAGFRGEGLYTQKLQARCDELYLEWYCKA